MGVFPNRCEVVGPLLQQHADGLRIQAIAFPATGRESLTHLDDRSWVDGVDILTQVKQVASDQERRVFDAVAPGHVSKGRSQLSLEL